MYQQALGTSLQTVSQTVSAAAKVIEDPALPEVSCQILRLNAITSGRNPGPPCPRMAYSPAQRQKGVGLYMAVKPLRVVVWARENPVAALVAGAAVVGLIGYVGYRIGKSRRSA